MAFISEIKYDGSGEGAHNEFLEITLMPGENPADYTVSFINVDGTLIAASSFFTTGEFTLQDVVDLAGSDGIEASIVGGLDLQVIPHPDNPDATIFVIPSTLSGGSADGAEAVVLTDTSSGTPTVISAYDIAGSDNTAPVNDPNSIVPAGTDPTPMGNAETYPGNNVARQWDYLGNTTKGKPNPGASTICLTAETEVATADGICFAGDLERGMMVAVQDGDYRPITEVFKRYVTRDECIENDSLQPVLIRAGSLAPGIPSKDLRVSRQHRMLVRSDIAEQMFSEPEVLVPAINFVGCPGISIEIPDTDIVYCHILMDRHEIIFAHDTPTETLLFTDTSISFLPPSDVQKIKQQTPFRHMIGGMEPARRLPNTERSKKLIQRINKRHEDFICPERPQIANIISA